MATIVRMLGAVSLAIVVSGCCDTPAISPGVNRNYAEHGCGVGVTHLDEFSREHFFDGIPDHVEWYLCCMFYARADETRDDQELLRHCIDQLRGPLQNEATELISEMGGHVESVEILIARDRSDGDIDCTAGVIVDRDQLENPANSPEELVAKAFSKSPPVTSRTIHNPNFPKYPSIVDYHDMVEDYHKQKIAR